MPEASTTRRHLARRSGKRRRRLLAEQLEDRRLLAGDFDYGDAPDTAVGTAVGNYQTTAADGGPAHRVIPGLRLGDRVDTEIDADPSDKAVGDDRSSLLADVAGDFVAGTTAGESVQPVAAGGGTWQYLASFDLNPSSPSANLQEMVWDTGGGAFETPTLGSPTDGFNGTWLGFPSGSGEIYTHPRRFTPHTVSRWTAGPDDSGLVNISGRVRKSAIRGGDGVSFYIFVDGTQQYQTNVNGFDGSGIFYELDDVEISPGSTVDFVVTSNPSNNDFDGTRYSATIALRNDEDGVVEDLRDLTLASGNSPNVTLDVTNDTADDALLAGWIDYNANGLFEPSEMATASIPAGSGQQSVVLDFPEVPDQWVYNTYARFRLSSDTDFVADPQPIGSVESGEVEDYLVGGRTTRIWDGDAGDNDLVNAANWATLLPSGEIVNNNRIPRFGEYAVIPPEFSDQTLVLDRSTSNPNRFFEVGSIQSSAPIQIVESGKLVIDEDSRIAALTIDRSGNALGVQANQRQRLEIAGDLVWNEGNVERILFDVEGNFTAQTDRSKSGFGSIITIHGDNSVWSDGAISLNSSRIENYGTFTTTSVDDVQSNGSASFVNREGATWIHDAPAVADDPKELFGALYNHGTFEVRQGSVQVGNCCTQVTHRGTFLLGEDAELTIDGPSTFAEESSIDGDQNSIFGLTGSSTVRGTFDFPETLLITGSSTFAVPVTVKNLVMDESSSLRSEQTFTITEHFDWRHGTLAGGGGNVITQGTTTMGVPGGSGGMTLRGRWINQGEATWQATNFGFGGGVLQNEGLFVDASDGTMQRGVFSNGTVDNRGQWIVDDSVGSGAEVARDVSYTNRGHFDIGNSNTRVYQFNQNDGTLQLGGGRLAVYNTMQINDGVIAGVGQIVTDVTHTGGTFSPGASPGLLQIDGQLTSSGGGVNIQIAGPPLDGSNNDTAGVNYDKLTTTESVRVDGRLAIEVIDGYTPVLGDSYEIISGSSPADRSIRLPAS